MSDETSNSEQMISREEVKNLMMCAFDMVSMQSSAKGNVTKAFVQQSVDDLLDEHFANENEEEAGREASELMRMVNTTPAWKDVDEVLPETNKMILCFGENGMFTGWLASDGGTWKTFECDIVDGKANRLRKDKLENVTHWMCLPKPPSDKT